MKRKLFLIASSCIIGLLFSSCTKEKELTQPTTSESLGSALKYFPESY